MIHNATGKIAVYDQDGHIFDGITFQELTTPVTDAYTSVEGMPFSSVKTEEERLQDTLNTIKASGAVDPDSMAKFEKMLLDIQKKQNPETEAPLDRPKRGYRPG